MNYDIFAKVVLALSICGLAVSLIHIVIKTILAFLKAVYKQPVEINFGLQIWTAGICVFLIAMYFIFL